MVLGCFEVQVIGSVHRCDYEDPNTTLTQRQRESVSRDHVGLLLCTPISMLTNHLHYVDRVLSLCVRALAHEVKHVSSEGPFEELVDVLRPLVPEQAQQVRSKGHRACVKERVREC